MEEEAKEVYKTEIIQVISQLLEQNENNNNSPSISNLSTSGVSTQSENVIPFMCPMSRVMSLASHCTSNHRWTAAAKFFPAVARHISAKPLSVWKIGAACLAYHENSNRTLMSNFAGAMIQAGRFASPEVLLDHVIYMMCNGEYEEACRFIDNYKKKCPKSYSETLWATLQGTRGLLEYINWRENLQISESSNDADPLESIGRESKIINHAERSIDCFKNSLSCASNFDVFIVKLIEVLEYYERLDEADQALASYIQLNYRQPTPYIFMLNFIQKHYPDDIQRQIYILKELIKFCPCDSHVLKLVKLLPPEETQYKMEILFNFVDYDEWRKDLEVWKNLTEVILTRNDNSRVHHLNLRKYIDERASWWSLYHFNISELNFGDPKLRELAVYKAVLATIMFNSAHNFVKSVSSKLSEEGDVESSKKLSDFLVIARQVGEAIKMSLREVEVLPLSNVPNVYFTSESSSRPVLSQPKNTLVPRSNSNNVFTKPNILKTYIKRRVPAKDNQSETIPNTTTAGQSFLETILNQPIVGNQPNFHPIIVKRVSTGGPRLIEINSLPVNFMGLNGQARLQVQHPIGYPPTSNNGEILKSLTNESSYSSQNVNSLSALLGHEKQVKRKIKTTLPPSKKQVQKRKWKFTPAPSEQQIQKRKKNLSLPMPDKIPASVNGSNLNIKADAGEKSMVKIEDPQIGTKSADFLKTTRTAKVALKRLTEWEIEKYCKHNSYEIDSEVITLE